MNHCGGGKCQLCGALKANKATCPLNKSRKGTRVHKLGPGILDKSHKKESVLLKSEKLKPKELSKKAIKVKVSKKQKTITPSASICKNGNQGSITYTNGVLLAKELILKDKSLAVNPVGWWASEKFDGYRALWNGKEFISRNGKSYAVPIWFSSLMPPDIALDGELWMGRCKFNECGIFRKKTPIDREWIDGLVKYKVFDMPGLNEPFEKRMEVLNKLVNNRCKCALTLKLPEDGNYIINCPLTVTKHKKITSLAELNMMFKTVTDAGGEGIMIRQPRSYYEPKRSSTLLKMKVTYDTECKIVGYKEGTRKYKGLLGSFECVLMKGSKKSFYVSGMDDEIRKDYITSHPINTVITIQYNDVTNHGIPRHPRYLRKRDDYELSKS